jgi:hypothetical protein
MTDEQAQQAGDDARREWARTSLSRHKQTHTAGAWYATDTRESIRDETLRSGLVALGAVVERSNVAVTSSLPRYALARHFADLLIALSTHPEDQQALIERWRSVHLSPTALSRINLLLKGALQAKAKERVLITLPTGETHLMRPGPSTFITKAVVEDFVRLFLHEPAVVWVSESGD